MVNNWKIFSNIFAFPASSRVLFLRPLFPGTLSHDAGCAAPHTRPPPPPLLSGFWSKGLPTLGAPDETLFEADLPKASASFQGPRRRRQPKREKKRGGNEKVGAGEKKSRVPFCACGGGERKGKSNVEHPDAGKKRMLGKEGEEGIEVSLAASFEPSQIYGHIYKLVR